MITAECWNGTSHTRFSALLPPWGPRLGSRRSWRARRPASPVPTAVALPGVRRGRGARRLPGPVAAGDIRPFSAFFGPRLPGSRGGGPAGPAQPEPSAPSSPRAASRCRRSRSRGCRSSPHRPTVRDRPCDGAEAAVLPGFGSAGVALLAGPVAAGRTGAAPGSGRAPGNAAGSPVGP